MAGRREFRTGGPGGGCGCQAASPAPICWIGRIDF
jgi:hypothetical protein